jgi:hypothetical protein
MQSFSSRLGRGQGRKFGLAVAVALAVSLVIPTGALEAGAKTTTTKAKAKASKEPSIRKVRFNLSVSFSSPDGYEFIFTRLRCPLGRLFGKAMTLNSPIFDLAHGDRYSVEVELLGEQVCNLYFDETVSAITVNGVDAMGAAKPGSNSQQFGLPLDVDTDVAVTFAVEPFENSVPGYQNVRPRFNVSGLGTGAEYWEASVSECVDVLNDNRTPYTGGLVDWRRPGETGSGINSRVYGRAGSSCLFTMTSNGLDLGSRLVLLLNGVEQSFAVSPEGVVSVRLPFEGHVNVNGFIRPITPDPLVAPKAAKKKEPNKCVTSVAKSKDGKVVAVAQIC